MLELLKTTLRRIDRSEIYWMLPSVVPARGRRRCDRRSVEVLPPVLTGEAPHAASPAAAARDDHMPLLTVTGLTTTSGSPRSPARFAVASRLITTF